MHEHNFEFEANTAFALDDLPVTKLTRMLRTLGERGDFARVVKSRQIAIIERHSVEEQAEALRRMDEDPEHLRLSDATPEATAAIRAVTAGPQAVAEALPELEDLARQMARLMLGARSGGLDRNAVAEVVREVVREELSKIQINLSFKE